MMFAACSMCGGAEIQTRYHEGENYWGDKRHCAYGSAATPTAHSSGPHLHRTCETCGYDWIEPTLLDTFAPLAGEQAQGEKP